MDEETIGMNAGKIWTTLHQSGSLTKHQLMMRTQLPEPQLNQAVGWLARENKIKKDGAFFCLDETNLTETIGENAGILYTVMQQIPKNISVLHKLTDFNKEELHQAIGWLAKEGNITPSAVTTNHEIDESKETIDFLNEEIQSLHQDVMQRNDIIQDLSKQLTNKQTEIIERAEVVEHLNKQLTKGTIPFTATSKKLKEAQQSISLLTEEIQSLHQELVSRNQIIQQLTTQLNEKQLAFIERSDALDRLQTSLCRQNQKSLSGVTSEVQQRIHHVQNLQETLEQKESHLIGKHAENSMLINKNTPTIRIDQEQHQEICQQLNNVLQRKTSDHIFDEKNEAISAVHDKKGIHSERNHNE